MLITFTAGNTTENVEVGEFAAVPQRLAAITSNPIYITVPSGTTPIQGGLTAGSSPFYPILGTANGNYIGFFAGQNKTLLVTKCLMDDATAVTDGLTNIAVALAAGDGAIILNSDGTTSAPV